MAMEKAIAYKNRTEAILRKPFLGHITDRLIPKATAIGATIA
jgi:hypothetical protein